MFRFVLVTIYFPGVPKVRDLEPAFTAVGDWVRFSVTTWIVWTDKPAAEIYVRIRTFLDAQDQLLVAKFDPIDAFGSAPPWMWTWVNSKVPNSIRTGTDMDNVVSHLLLPPPGSLKR